MSDPCVLLVEDNSIDALMVRRAFEKANIATPIHVMDDGDKALAYLSGAPPYDERERYPIPVLVLLDLKLPRLSGLELLRWLKEQPRLKRLPVLVLTSSGESVDVNRAYDLGANSYLVKPVDFNVLLELIRALGLYWMVLNRNPDTEAI